MNGQLHHVEIYVSDLNKSKKFWAWLLTQKLNYVLYQEWDQGVSFRQNDTYLVFVQTEDQYQDIHYHRKRTGLNHLAFYGESKQFVDQLTDELRERGVTILYADRHPHAEQYYAVFFEDPDRIKVEVVAE
ncbi:MAG: VOC family protein [Sphingobacteriales bacterium]|nr:MAG: VOC family protein [Sphingobacteriales bacterium]